MSVRQSFPLSWALTWPLTFGLSGGGVPPVVGPNAPVLAMDPSWDTTQASPAFTIDIDDTIAEGDDVRLQIQVAGGDWSSPVSDTTHTITSGEDSANEIDLSLSALSNNDYEARALVNDGVADSDWSNVVSFTVAAAGVDGRLMWGTDQQLWSTDHLIWA